MVNIFFVGATGHIGGAVLDQLLQKHADAKVKALVRDEGKAARLAAKYPQVECVVGDTGNLEVLENCSKAADIVINTSPDITHDAGIKAILTGLKARDGVKPYYIHTSGASLIWDEPTGSKDARWWDDIADIGDICAFKGEAHTHAVTDKIVRDAAPNVNVAIVSPGFVGGMSPSIEHSTPITMPAIFLTARAFKSGWHIAEGENTHAWIDVSDLARMYLVLVGKAIDGASESEPFDIWGPDAYYFGTSEDISFGKFMKHLVPVLKENNVIETTDIKSVSVIEAARASIAGSDYDPDAPPPPPDTWAMHIAIMYGINMRVRASRMEKLGWKAEKGSIVDTFPQVVAEYLKREKLDNKE
ncbi:nucleoside-diphosphate-sugar epimerase [Colletotrichum truncatum]|uniref:Nucleoside-diphosphate-sugar epimerase n=1 Tax=Colletotrichum truncatum TaxID=5467 RepID=A0ACC3ZHH7_COLTU|nr:nucleoside-diphosphate-sugar epimerase [Colletotrichum truncatum]KAF6790543.1 nucleoside-diphosphate-sugar epimerase [Colletotrichum truncatum]